ncbi:unnamed protein product [Protopolystoma xenopodis]|uniref:Uncharacterized protein n=1 Tax=Protopolystoma xenopodis TaxID=117903 RepID=A0A3S5BHD6_9PLAT|nr:unnamed protein product [Protopolystoma xenopodis]
MRLSAAHSLLRLLEFVRAENGFLYFLCYLLPGLLHTASTVHPRCLICVLTCGCASPLVAGRINSACLCSADNLPDLRLSSPHFSRPYSSFYLFQMPTRP